MLATVALVLAGLGLDSGEVRSGGASRAGAAVAAVETGHMRPDAHVVRPEPRRLPSAAALRSAARFAHERGGLVSLAVVNTAGQLRGRDESRRYVSASVVKAMLLAAELRRLHLAGLPLDDETAAALQAMITYSDNASADTIYYRVGDAGLFDVARRAEMRRFTVAGYWANAQITAADMARFFSSLDKQMAGPHREFALGLLGSVVPEQRWGIPAAAGKRWAVRFKGGWRSTELGSLVHQAAELRHGDRRLAVAILTDGQPSQEYAIATVRGVAERLLARTVTGRRVSAGARTSGLRDAAGGP